MPLDDVFELIGLFLLDVRCQEDGGPSQTVILEEQTIGEVGLQVIFHPEA